MEQIDGAAAKVSASEAGSGEFFDLENDEHVSQLVKKNNILFFATIFSCEKWTLTIIKIGIRCAIGSFY